MTDALPDWSRFNRTSKTVTFAIHGKLLEKVNKRSEIRGTSRSALIRDALVVYMDFDNNLIDKLRIVIREEIKIALRIKDKALVNEILKIVKEEILEILKDATDQRNVL